MAQVAVFKRSGTSATLTPVVEASDEIIARKLQRATSGVAALWDDANVTSITIGGGAAQTTTTVGKAGQNTTVLGSLVVDQNLTVSGTTTTLNVDNVTIEDALILLSSGAATGVDSGIAIERGATGDDAVMLWEEGNDRFEFGTFNTVGGTVVPGSITAFSNVKVSSLLLAGTAVTADGALTITATGAVALTFATNSASQWAVSAAGNFVSASGANDIGTTTLADRPNNVYVETSVVVGSTTTLTTSALTGSGALTVTATAAVLSLDGTGLETSATTLTSDAGFGVVATGALALGAAAATTAVNVATDANAKTVTIGNVTGASATVINTGTGGLDINATGAGGITIDAGATGAFSIDGFAASNLSTTSAGLTVSTITSGTLAVTSAGALNLTGAAASLWANSGGTLTIRSTSAAMTIETVTSGTMTITSAGALNVNATAVASTWLVSDLTVSDNGTLTLNGDYPTNNSTLALGTNATLSALAGNDVILSVGNNAASDIVFTAHGGTNNVNSTTNTTITGFTDNSIVGAIVELGNASQPTYGNDTGSTIEANRIVAPHTGADDIQKSVATSDNIASRVVGVTLASIANTATGRVSTNGRLSIAFVASLTLANGDEVYLSTTSGLATNVAPSTAGNVVQHIGYVTDASTYTGVLNDLAKVQLAFRGRLVL